MAVFNTGTTGKIHIEDTGSWIHIYLEAGQPATNVGNLTFSWNDPLSGGNRTGSISYPAGSGKKLALSLGPFGPGQGGTIYFTMNATGTQGFGGPTSVSMPFSRSSPPSQVGGLFHDEIRHRSIDIHWSFPNQNGGVFQFNQYQISSAPQSGIKDFEGNPEITANTNANDVAILDKLMPGRLYYWHVRSINNAGYGAWSNVLSFRTQAGCLVRVSGIWKYAIPYVKVNGKWVASVPYVKRADIWREAIY